MRTINKSVLIAAAVFLSSLLCSTHGNCIEEISIQGSDWKLIIHSFQDGLTKIPVIGGLTSISAGNNEEGVVIRGEIQPTGDNDRLLIELKDFKLSVGGKEFSPATADVRIKGKNNVESVQWPSGHSSTLNKGDFPAAISIMYLVTKNIKKVLLIKGGDPVPLPHDK
jgi:hypothetical protein